MADHYLVISQSWEEQPFQSYQILKTSKHEGIEHKMHSNKNVIAKLQRDEIIMPGVGSRHQYFKSWCTGTTQREGMGREKEGGFRMGNTGIPVADSF